jgi:hypothetical protein
MVLTALRQLSSGRRAALNEVQRFRRRQATTLARLRQVTEALSRWDELDAAALMPADRRPRVAPPALPREVLKALQRELVRVLGELEAAWERRN